ncbi:YkgJ family cysteine cluster protein [Candidatus Woesearchaeota archaeon]|nr:YkgJ family cysteine cluster protein [Candidatus Woesearchaeota archaeon]
MECQHCGMCCGDNRININLTVGDIWRICSHLKISVDKFFENYSGFKKFGDPRNPDVFDVDLGLNMPCKFWVDNRCSIYSARPVNCRIFPYWLLASVPDEQVKDILHYKCKYDLSKKKMYKKYQDAIGKVLMEESKWFDVDKQIGNEEIKDKVPIEEIREIIAKKLNKIGRHSKDIEDAERILKKKDL